MATKAQYQVGLVNETNPLVTAVTIAAGTETSTVIDCGGTTPTAILIPSNFTSADLSFYACRTPGGTFLPITNFDGTSFSISLTASQWVPLNPAMFNSVTYLQVVSSVNQTDAITLDFQLAPIFSGFKN